MSPPDASYSYLSFKSIYYRTHSKVAYSSSFRVCSCRLLCYQTSRSSSEEAGAGRPYMFVYIHRHSKPSYYGPGLQAPKRLNVSEQQIELNLQLNLSPPQISSNGSGIRNGDCEGSDSQFRAVESICLFM
jgi:hypothetical protein